MGVGYDRCDCGQNPGEDVLKPLFEEGCQAKPDGVVTEFVVNHNSLEQPSSQANWIATQSTTARNEGNN